MKEAIVLLAKNSCILSRIYEEKEIPMPEDLEQLSSNNSQALAILKQPKCKRCGDRKPESYLRWLCELKEEDEQLGHKDLTRTHNQKRELYQMYVNSFLVCPDCQQPKDQPSSKLTKKFRELIKLSEEHLSDNKIGRLQAYGKEACKLLDKSEAEKENLHKFIVEILGDVSVQDFDRIVKNTLNFADLQTKLDTSEASRKELLEACKETQKLFAFIAENYKSAPHFPTAERLVDAVIAKAEKEGKRESNH